MEWYIAEGAVFNIQPIIKKKKKKVIQHFFLPNLHQPLTLIRKLSAHGGQATRCYSMVRWRFFPISFYRWGCGEKKKKRLTDEIFPPHIHTGGSLLEKFQSSHRLTDMLWLRWEGGWVWETAEAGCEEYPLFRRRAELHCVRSHWYRPEETRQPAMRWEGRLQTEMLLAIIWQLSDVNRSY